MANIYESMNVKQKLAKARLYFLNKKVTKSGKNMNLEFKYFELEDIVPVAIRIFARVGLVTNTVFDGQTASMRVYNADDPNEPGITFTAPYREVEQIISNKGKVVTNVMQALGSSITYLRRYLWMMALDITEPDDVDATLGSEGYDEDDLETPAPAKSTPKPPATPQERAAAKEELTSADGAATDDQITELKGLCKELMEKDDIQEDFVQQIAMETDGFTNITASACTELCKNLSEILEQCGE